MLCCGPQNRNPFSGPASLAAQQPGPLDDKMNNSTEDLIYIISAPIFIIALGIFALWAVRRSHNDYQRVHRRRNQVVPKEKKYSPIAKPLTKESQSNVERIDYFKIFILGVPLMFIVWFLLIFLAGPINAIYLTLIVIPGYITICALYSKELGLRTYEPNDLRQKVLYVFLTVLIVAQIRAYYIGYVDHGIETPSYSKGAVLPFYILALAIDWYFKKSSNK